MLQFLFTHTPLFFLTQTFWRDEAFSYFMAKKNIVEIIFLTARDFNPPLYYFLLHFWIKIFGSSEIAMRSLSIIFFWGTIYVAFLFLKNIFKLKEKKALFYLILFILNPLLIYYAFEARMYSMFAFLATLSYYSFFKKDNRLYLLSTIAGLFTHYFMVLVVLSQLFYLLVNKANLNYVSKKTVKLSLLIFLPWLIFFLFQNSLQRNFWIARPHFKDAFGLLGIIYTGNESAFYPGDLISKIKNSVIYLSILLSLIIILGIKKKATFNLLFIWGVGIPLLVGLVSFVKPIYFPRYMIFATVGLVLLIIYILEKLNLKLRIVLLTTLIILTFSYQKLQIQYRKKTDIRKTLREIQVIANKNDLIYVNDLDFFTVKYYLNNDNVYIYGKSYEDIPAFNGKVLIPKEKIASSFIFYPRKAFTLKSNGQYSISAMY